jgi:hypothetical protein
MKSFFISILAATLLCASMEPVAAADLSRAQVRFVSPCSNELFCDLVTMRLEVSCSDSTAWRVLDTHAESQVSTLIAEGSGPISADQIFTLQDPLAGSHCFSIYLNNEQTAAAEANCTVNEAALPGWFHRPSLYGKRFSHESDLFTSFGLVRFELEPKTPILPEQLWLECRDDAGQMLPNWPVDLSALGMNLGSTVLPLQVGDGLLLASSGQLVLFASDGTQTHNLLVESDVMAAPMLWYDTDARLHIVFLSGLQGQAQMLLLDAELGVEQTLDLGFYDLPQDASLTSADLNADGQREIFALLEDAAGSHVHRIAEDFSHSTIFRSITSFQGALHAGEITGDGRSDLLFSSPSLLLAFDESGLIWQQSPSAGTFSDCLLHDMDGDHQQELLWIENQTGGGSQLRALTGAQEAFAPFDALDLRTDAQVLQAPRPVKLADGQCGLACVLLSNAPLLSTEVLLLSQTAEPFLRRYMPGQILANIYLRDLDDSGSLDLLLEDDAGWMAAWDLTLPLSPKTSPFGSALHDGNFMQPISSLALPRVLSGPLVLIDAIETDSLLLHEVALLSGSMSLGQFAALEGDLIVHPDATLRFEADLSLQNHLTSLQHFGVLAFVGAGADLSDLPSEPSPESVLLANLPLQTHAGAAWTFDSFIWNPGRTLFDLGTDVSLVMQDCWILDSGLALDASSAQFDRCLFLGMDQGLCLNMGSIAAVQECVFSSVQDIGIDNTGGDLTVLNTIFLTSEIALRHGSAGVTEVDSCHFQANTLDLMVTANPATVSLDYCDFVETWDVAIRNQASGVVNARNCYWEVVSAFEGDVSIEPQLDAPVKPILLPQPVLGVDPGPMVDGDEPLEWQPVEFTDDGTPVQVDYCIYRSDAGYGVFAPENLIARTSDNYWFDADMPARAFYCVTTTFGKPVP